MARYWVRAAKRQAFGPQVLPSGSNHFVKMENRRFGGARRNRTADLYNAIVALSQLSYDPVPSKQARLGQRAKTAG